VLKTTIYTQAEQEEKIVRNILEKNTSTGIFSSTLSIASVIGPVIAGSIAFYLEYVSVMYFAIVIIIFGFLISLRIKT